MKSHPTFVSNLIKIEKNENTPIPRIIRNGAVLLPDLDSCANGRHLVLTAADYPVPEPEPEPIRANS